eukprot:jgi/Psemu1/305234/fgenesh1_kg.187_\
MDGFDAMRCDAIRFILQSAEMFPATIPIVMHVSQLRRSLPAELSLASSEIVSDLSYNAMQRNANRLVAICFRLIVVECFDAE